MEGIDYVRFGQWNQWYNDLACRIGGASPKMLTQTLRSLERNGLIERRTYGVGEQRVEYFLT